MSTISFKDRVAVITGAGGGLGFTYAREIAKRGGKVVINDISNAEQAVETIRSEGGQAVPDSNNIASAEGGAALIRNAIDQFGRVDIVINNAGILRDASIVKMPTEQFDLLIDVHLKGSFYVSKAAFPHMKEQGYGRFVFTTSAAGLFGNFGQANYAAAKMGLVGLSNVFAIEGHKSNIKSNVIAPGAKTAMTESMGEQMDVMPPESVMPLVVYLCSEDCQETHSIYSAAAGRFAKVFIGCAPGWFAGLSAVPSVEEIGANMDEINSQNGYQTPLSVFDEAMLLQTVMKE